MTPEQFDSSLSLAVGIVSFLILVLAIFSYRRLKKGRRPGGWTSVQALQSLLEPDKKVIMEVRAEEQKEESDSGAPPDRDQNLED